MNAIRQPRSLLVLSLAVVGLGLATWHANAAELRLEIFDGSGARTPARVHLRDATGKSLRAGELPFWRDHIVCTGSVTFTLAAGDYHWTIERGPEWSITTGTATVNATDAKAFTNTLRRLVDLTREGWWCGETHVHRALPEVELLMRAEDLHVGQVITWWNKVNPWTNAASLPKLPAAFDQNRFHHPLGGEDERDGGALLYMDLPEPLPITSGARHFPSSLVFAKQARARGATWIDAEKPFWWDFPLWVAHGVADTVGIAHNHMHRGGVLDNEAWGRPRDAAKYPGPQGNGRYSQDIYYHLLNCGVRLPPSAGSASGVLPNPVGYNRAYVHIEGAFTNEKWRDGLKAGRSFVSNGPLLRARANGFLPGHVFRTNGTLQVQLEAKLDSRETIAAVELVRNGQVERVTLPVRITLPESGWFLLRAVADVTNTFRFASTAPWYVELDGQPMKPRREAAQFYIDWCRERTALLGALTEVNAAQKEQLLQPWREAEAFWESKLAAAR